MILLISTPPRAARTLPLFGIAGTTARNLLTTGDLP